MSSRKGKRQEQDEDDEEYKFPTYCYICGYKTEKGYSHPECLRGEGRYVERREPDDYYR